MGRVKKVITMWNNARIRTAVVAALFAFVLAGCPMPLETPLLRSVKETVGAATRTPSPPVVTVASPTNDTTPSWSWSIPAGVVDIRYQLDVEAAGGWTVVGGIEMTSFAPLAALSEGDHTLYVQGSNQTGGWSASGSATAAIDITAPSAPVVTGLSPTNDATPTWNWTVASDVIGIRSQMGSESAGGWVEASSSVTSYTPAIDLADGLYTLYVQAKDAAGNWSTSGSRTIEVNQAAASPPEVTGTSPNNDSTPTWSWSTPPGSFGFRYQVDSESAGGWTEVALGVTSYAPPNPLSEGSHTLYVQAVNSVAFWSASGSFAIFIDITAPTATAQINGGALYTATQNVNVSLTADDGAGSGVQQMMLSNDAGFAGASWEAFGSPRAWTLSTLDGIKTVYVKVRDAAGNESITQTPSITLDTLKPTAPGTPDLAAADDTGISTSDNLTKNTTGLTFSGSGAEPNAALKLYSDKDGSLGSTTVTGGGTWTIDVSLSANKTHGITATLTDAAGNVSDASSALSVVVDTTAPSLIPSLLTPFQGQNTGTNKRPTFRWTASDPGCTYELQVDDNANFASLYLNPSTAADVISYTPISDMSVSGSVPKGTRYYIRVRALDPAGNPGGWSNAGYTRYVNVGRFDSDFNGDGYSDVIVGSPYYDAGTAVDAGRAYIYLGGSTMNSVADVILLPSAAGDNFGWSVACAGDVNGDGYADAIVGAPYNDTGFTDAGRAYIYLGGSTMNVNVDYLINGAAAGDHLGQSVASAGDVNGDGYSDVIVGAPYNDTGGSNKGAAGVYFGGSFLQGIETTADVTMTGFSVSDGLGGSVASAGDVNGDGYADVIVSVPGSDSEGTDAGRAVIYFGGSAMDQFVDVILAGGVAGDTFGQSVASAGDVNGDGYTDVVVGAYHNDAAAANAGAAYVYLGGSFLVPMETTADVTLLGAAASDQFGISVASAGDVDGDGYADVIVGADWNDVGGANAGRAYIYRGGSPMDVNVYVTLTGVAAGDLFGISVAPAGDVNGNGYADVIVGAIYNDLAFTDAGAAYVYLGGSSMDSAADVILTGATAGDIFGYSVY